MKNELKIGWVLILALGLVFGFLAWLKKTNFFYSGIKIYAWFPDASGLRIGDPVSINGRILGSLAEFKSPGPDSSGWIGILNFEEKPTLYEDAIAIIQVKEITGGRIVDINPGNSGIPFKHSVMSGKTAWDIGALLREIQPLVAFFQDSSFHHFIRNGNKLLEQANQINPQQAISQVESVLHQTSKLLGHTNQLMTNPQNGVPAVMKDLQLTLSKVQEMLDTIRPILSNVSQVNMTETLVETRQLIQQTSQFIHNTDSLLSISIRDSSTLAGAVLSSPAMKDELQQTLLQLRETLHQIQEGKLKARIRF